MRKALDNWSPSCVDELLVGDVLGSAVPCSTLPILLRRLGFDPAASSAPFVATLVGVTGPIICFTAAALILRRTLL